MNHYIIQIAEATFTRREMYDLAVFTPEGGVIGVGASYGYRSYAEALKEGLHTVSLCGVQGVIRTRVWDRFETEHAVVTRLKVIP